MQQSFTVPTYAGKLGRNALIVGGLATLLAAFGAFTDWNQFLRSYMAAYIYALSIPLGALGLLMLQHLSGGAWGIMSRRVLEAATRTLPLMALLFIPVLMGMSVIFPWMDHAKVAANHVMHLKEPYLNQSFFIIRFAAYFAIWLVLAFLLNKYSNDQDQTGDPRIMSKFQKVSGAGTVLFVLTVNFAATDWVMSLNEEWFSTIFGILIMIGMALMTMAFVIVVVSRLADEEPMASAVKPTHLHDWGKLMFAFMLVWAYFSFSQLLITWSGNLPEEIPYYLTRVRGGWKTVAAVLVLLHFALPFALLLSRSLKRNRRTLSVVAAFIICVRYVDLYWTIKPEFSREGFNLHWLDVVLPIALLGLFLTYFAYQLKRRPLLPAKDPFLAEALHPAGH